MCGRDGDEQGVSLDNSEMGRISPNGELGGGQRLLGSTLEELWELTTVAQCTLFFFCHAFSSK